MSRVYLWLALAAAGTISACASAPADRGVAEVQALLNERGAPAVSLDGATGDADITSLLNALLTPERAVGIALLRNPEVRMEYARLGLVQADVLEAGRLSNPELSLSALDTNAAGESMRLGYGLVQNFTNLLLLRARSHLARGRLDQEKARVAERIRSLALSVKAAAIEATSAAQVAAMRGIVAKSARTAADLAQRFFDAGNISQLELTREQAAATEAALAADAAQAQSELARGQLNRLMGLHANEQGWKLHEGLPNPVEDEEPFANLQALALAQRLDLQARRDEAKGAVAAADLVQRWRWLPFLALGVGGERDSDGAQLIGPTLSLELPLFNQGQDRVLRAQGFAELAEAGVAQLELEIGTEVAAAYGRMTTARNRAARHVRELIPQREAVVARMQEMQNYMLVGQFELILARQQEYDAYQSWLEAVRDYWLARGDLEHAVGAALPSDGRIGTANVAPPVVPDAALGNDAHGHHQ
ncbi:MAG: TolC family protein [Gammaproteobacteria bacterium]|nr:TolC family protein [Gammaproteobacteria bacterium]